MNCAWGLQRGRDCDGCRHQWQCSNPEYLTLQSLDERLRKRETTPNNDSYSKLLEEVKALRWEVQQLTGRVIHAECQVEKVRKIKWSESDL